MKRLEIVVHYEQPTLYVLYGVDKDENRTELRRSTDSRYILGVLEDYLSDLEGFSPEEFLQ